MGRKFLPIGETINGVNQDFHFVSVAMLIACIAATFAIISSLCGSLSRKKSEPPPLPPPTSTTPIINEVQENNNRDGTTTTTAQKDYYYSSSQELLKEELTKDNNNNNTQDDDVSSITSQQQQYQPLPPPPGRRHLSSTISYHFRSDSTASTSSQPTSSATKLPTSMSMRVFGTGLGSRQTSKRDNYQMGDFEKRKDRDKKLLKHEDSIWKKTIILGEKCKIPDEDEETILYDEKGNRISTYHPKGLSKPLSRQNSMTDPADSFIR